MGYCKCYFYRGSIGKRVIPIGLHWESSFTTKVPCKAVVDAVWIRLLVSRPLHFGYLKLWTRRFMTYDLYMTLCSF